MSRLRGPIELYGHFDQSGEPPNLSMPQNPRTLSIPNHNTSESAVKKKKPPKPYHHKKPPASFPTIISSNPCPPNPPSLPHLTLRRRRQSHSRTSSRTRPERRITRQNGRGRPEPRRRAPDRARGGVARGDDGGAAGLADAVGGGAGGGGGGEEEEEEEEREGGGGGGGGMHFFFGWFRNGVLGGGELVCFFWRFGFAKAV